MSSHFGLWKKKGGAFVPREAQGFQAARLTHGAANSKSSSRAGQFEAPRRSGWSYIDYI